MVMSQKSIVGFLIGGRYFRHLSNRPMRPKQLQYLTIENQTAKDELEKMRKGRFKGSEVIKICNLLECLLRFRRFEKTGFDAYDITKDETLEYEYTQKSLLNFYT